MKSLFTTVLFCLVCISSFAQAREDRKNIVLSQRSGKLIKATGWMINKDNGKWVSNTNAMNNMPTNGYNSHSPNFKWMQTASFDYKGEKHFVFFELSAGGYFKYPAIRQDWIEEDEISYSLMTLDEYAQFTKALDKTDGSVTLIGHKYTSDLLPQQNEAAMLAQITTLLSNDGPMSDGEMAISVQVVNGVKAVRFQDVYLGDLLKDEYYETDPTSFKALFIPLTAEEYVKADKLAKIHDSIRAASTPEAIQAKKNKVVQDEIDKKAAVAAKIADDRAKEKEAKAKDSMAVAGVVGTITQSWASSDTLRGISCTWQADKSVGEPQHFAWMICVSLDWKGQKKYLICYHTLGMESIRKECSFLVLEPQQYAQMRDAVNAKNGDDVKVSSKISAASYSSYDVAHMLKDILSDPTYTAPESCLEFDAKKGKVRFRLPGGTCPENGISAKSGWSYFECDAKEFAKLVTLP